MRNIRLFALGRALAPLSILAALAVAPIGCGGDEKAKEAGTAQVPPSIQKANSDMESHMKTQQKK